MVRSSAVLVLLVLAAVVCTSHANWYGKRGDRADFFGLLMQQRLDGLTSRDMNAEVALAAIDQIIQIYRQHRTQSAMELKQGA
uniref:NdWFamide-1 n=1 Tax=Charonia tritonis TaxID=1960912 RepID=A0A1S6JQ43_9CAEN|nr:NdWFamide-1 precursor [Charonia tritonis]